MWSNALPGALPKHTPTNQVLIRMVKEYRADMPELLKDGIESTRSFFLKDIAPTVVSMMNGLQDGHDILKQAMLEEPQTTEYFNAMNGMLKLALHTKMSTFIAKHTKLNAEERAIFLNEVFAPKASHSITDIIKDLANKGKANTPVGDSAPQYTSRKDKRRDNLNLLKQSDIRQLRDVKKK